MDGVVFFGVQYQCTIMNIIKQSLLICVLSVVFGCGSSEEAAKEEKSSSKVEAEKGSSFWMTRLAPPEKLNPFVQDVGWQSYYNRNFQDSIRGAKEITLARFHLEHSALYRQSLLMYAHATKNLYTQYKSDDDPIQSQYFLAMSHIFLGEFKQGKTLLDGLGEEPVLNESISQWKTWLKTDKKAAPALNGFFFSTEGAGINNPPSWNEETYAFSLPSGSFYEPSEGTGLWLLAQWHEEQARTILKDVSYGEEVVGQWLSPWRLPFEASFSSSPTKKVLSLADDWFLFGFYLDGTDLAFSAAIPSDARGALKEFSQKSTLAREIQKCVQDEKVNPECLVDGGMALEESVRKENKEQTKDIPIEQLNAELLYETFPSFARYSLLRMGAIFALHNDQHRDSGILQLMVREASGPLRDPVFLTFFSAWEAGNNSTLRAQDLVHELSSEFNPLQTARVPLDFLHIRLGRNAVPSGASH